MKKYNFQRMDWWKSVNNNSSCKEAVRWVAQCKGPDDFYKNAPSGYLLNSIAARDNELGIRVLSQMIEAAGVEIHENLEEQFEEARLRIKYNTHTTVDRVVMRFIGIKLQKFGIEIVPVIIYLMSNLMSEEDMGKFIRKKVSKKNWLDLLERTNREAGFAEG